MRRDFPPMVDNCNGYQSKGSTYSNQEYENGEMKYLVYKICPKDICHDCINIRRCSLLRVVNMKTINAFGFPKENDATSRNE
jgi:hypothetical protein